MNKDSLLLRFLYLTVPGRILLKIIVHPTVSRIIAHYLSSPLSRWMIRYYQRKYQIELTGCEKQVYSSFNDFFTRKRNLSVWRDPWTIINPCDGFLSVYRITDNLCLQVKHNSYTIGTLLQDESLAKMYSGGICCIFRLEPHHYHHYLFAASGVIKKCKRINGVLHCVRPIACEQFPVYIQNSREYILQQNPILGNIIQMEVGALLVGRIQNNPVHNKTYYICGTEKGYFEFGGSTVILLFQKKAIPFLPRFSELCDTEAETTVSIGKVLGRNL